MLWHTQNKETPMKRPANLFSFLKSRNRIVVGPVAMMAGTAVFILAFDNKTFWAKGFEVFPGHIGQLSVLGLALFFLMLAVFSLFASRITLKPFLALVLILSSVTSYSMDRFGVSINRDVIQNLTTLGNPVGMISPDFILWFLFTGILPTLVIFWLRLCPTRLWKAICENIGMFSICLVLTAGLLFSNLKTYTSVFQDQKDFMASQQPGAAIIGGIRYVKMILNTPPT